MKRGVALIIVCILTWLLLSMTQTPPTPAPPRDQPRVAPDRKRPAPPRPCPRP